MSLTDTLVDWMYERKCLKTVEALNKNGFEAVYFDTAEKAAEYIVREAESATSIGFGGSMSVSDLKVQERLAEGGKEILNHGRPGLSPEERQEVMRRQHRCDLFLSGTNAVTVSGILVNIDAIGNRVGSMFFGPGKVIVVAGRNKIVEGDVGDAIKRAKEWACPSNARRLNYRTPCAETGQCVDCSSPERICRVTTIIEKKPKYTDLRILVVNENMGL
jgi:hypothetical protein